MRKEFVACRSRKTISERCPWAAVIIKVEEGFMAFESANDYVTWKNQK